MAINSLDDVRLFRQVVASGGISAAARAMRDSKNRISQRLAALERNLGVRLAFRTTRTFRLTEEGERFLASAEALLEAADRCESAVASTHARAGRIRMAIRSAVAGLGLGAELSQLMQSAPGLSLQVTVVDEGADLLAGGFDLLMQVGPLQDSSFTAACLGAIPIVLAATPAYLDAHGRPKTPADLARHRCIRKLGSEPERMWVLLDRQGRRCEAPISGAFECSDSQLQRDLLYAGYGIGPRPASEVRQAERTGRLERALPSWAFDPVPVWVLSPRGRLRLPRIALVVDHLKRVVARQVQEIPPV